MNPGFNYRAALLTAALTLACAASAFAANVQLLPDVIDNNPGDELFQTCATGELRAGNVGTVGLLGPGVTIYQRLRLSQCATCDTTTGGLVLLNAYARLRFGAACNLTVRVSVVGGSGPDTCAVPDPAMVLCQPSIHTLSESASQTQSKSYQMPLPPGCCLEGRGPYFLKFEVLDRSCDANGIVSVYATGPCTPCTQYIEHPLLPPGILEECSGGFGRDYRLWADADCCGATRTINGSWGKLKTIYR